MYRCRFLLSFKTQNSPEIYTVHGESVCTWFWCFTETEMRNRLIHILFTLQNHENPSRSTSWELIISLVVFQQLQYFGDLSMKVCENGSLFVFIKFNIFLSQYEDPEHMFWKCWQWSGIRCIRHYLIFQLVVVK